MSPTPSSSHRTPTGRPRGRPIGSTNAARAARQASLAATAASEPPPKRRRYIPGGPGGGGRFIEGEDVATPRPAATASRARVLASSAHDDSPSLLPRRERSSRIRGFANEHGTGSEWGPAAAVVASVQHADDYKPREERSWEEFHPNLDIDGTFMVFRAHDVDGTAQETPSTPAPHSSAMPTNGSMTPSQPPQPASTGNTPNPPTQNEVNPFDSTSGTPTRRSRRPTREVISFYGTKPVEPPTTPKAPKILPIHNQTAKERLDLKLPSYRESNRVGSFESNAFGQARYVDKAMSNVGYQESDHYPRPEPTLIKAIDGGADEDADPLPSSKADDHNHHRIGRVEYDMDEQDDKWLEHYNSLRKQNELETITPEIFEITMTKIEKEWHALEKRIPKPNPKPPQTHRPRSSSAAAVNGEPPTADEPDSKCAICDDGDCENTNAIVFCDGCNLAVHQECYGVPFIPEGQWLCRKCQLCGRGIPTCIFCPNTEGAFKQTNSSKWAHLLCAMWIPEVSLGNHTFMEPVMDVEKVPKSRWKLSCYLCNQKMGACIQCGNKNCYQAFHVTCARRAHLFLKMKTSHGALAVLDGSMVLKAFCDKHCPEEYTAENNVHHATRMAKKFYRRNMSGRIWADNQTVANMIAAQQHDAAEEPADDSGVAGSKHAATATDKRNSQPPKNMWRLPSGAPIIPQAVFEAVEASIQRFTFRKRKEFLGEACRYWTLKREARRGAALLKRLQLQMDSFSSMELTRRDFSSMGPSGRARLSRRVEFSEGLVQDLDQLRELSDMIVEREQLKLDAAELEQTFVDECYFPVMRHLVPAMEKATSLDKDVFSQGLSKLQAHVDRRYYVTALSFAQELGDVISAGIHTPKYPAAGEDVDNVDMVAYDSTVKGTFTDIRERRKLGRRIVKAIQPYLDTALHVESEVSQKPCETLQREMETIFDASVDGQPPLPAADLDGQDTIMVDAPGLSHIEVANDDSTGTKLQGIDDKPVKSVEDEVDANNGGNIEVATSNVNLVNGEGSTGNGKTNGQKEAVPSNAVAISDTPPDSSGYVSVPRSTQTNGPPTPPQSNGSLGKEPLHPLTDGGVLWYLKNFEPSGTSVLEEHWTGREAVRMLSEDLTDMDEEELKGLGVDVDGSMVAVGSNAADADAAVENGTASKVRASRARRRRTSARRR